MPYVVFSFVWWGFKMLFAGHVNSTLEVKDLLFIFLYPLSFMWFIYALLIMVLVQIWIGEKAENGRFACVHLSVGFLLMAGQPVLAQAWEEVSFGDTVVSDVMKNYLYFLIGFYGCRLIVTIMAHEKRVWIALLTGAVLFLYNIVLYQYPLCQTLVCKIVVAISGSLFVFFVCHRMASWALLNAIGRCSLSIYVLQGLAIAVTRQALGMVYQPTDEVGWLPWAVCTGMGTLIPLLIYLASTKIGKLDFVFTPNKYLKS